MSVYEGKTLVPLNGKGGPETGVLGEHDNPGKSDRVEIRDLLTGKWVRHLFVLGGDFWDKIRALFLYNAKADFQEKL